MIQYPLKNVKFLNIYMHFNFNDKTNATEYLHKVNVDSLNNFSGLILRQFKSADILIKVEQIYINIYIFIETLYPSLSEKLR